MKRHIHFRDVRIAKGICIPCTQDVFDQAVAKHIKYDLRWDNKTGVMRDNRFGVLEKLVHQDEHIPCENIGEVIVWEFKRYVNNSISRLQRGHTP